MDSSNKFYCAAHLLLGCVQNSFPSLYFEAPKFARFMSPDVKSEIICLFQEKFHSKEKRNDKALAFTAPFNICIDRYLYFH
jgi:hypothetical protein